MEVNGALSSAGQEVLSYMNTLACSCAWPSSPHTSGKMSYPFPWHCKEVCADLFRVAAAVKFHCLTMTSFHASAGKLACSQSNAVLTLHEGFTSIQPPRPAKQHNQVLFAGQDRLGCGQERGRCCSLEWTGPQPCPGLLFWRCVRLHPAADTYSGYSNMTS